MFCSNCGNELNDSDNFCSKCGKPVNVEVETTNSDEKKDVDIDFDISLFGDNKFEACKYVAHTYNLSLREAKDIVDQKYKEQDLSNQALANYNISQPKPVEKTKDKKDNNSNIISKTLKLHCPRCKSNDIDLISTDKNYKTVQRTSLNFNLAHPFTVFNTKTVQKEKRSAKKTALAWRTARCFKIICWN